MGRPKDFPNIYQDLLAKHKSKGIADKEYKELLPMAREQGVSKEARLGDVDTTIVPTAHLKESIDKKRHSSAFNPSSEKKEDLTKHPPEKKQRVSGGFSHIEKELYERLVESERQRAQDLREIAMALASGKKDDVVIPPSPAGDGAEEVPADENASADEGTPDSPKPNPTANETPAKQRHDKLRTLAGVAAGVGGSAAKSQSKKGGGII